MDALRRRLCVEPAMFLYMTAAFIRMPVFQALLYEKVCLQRYGRDAGVDCSNSTEIRHDAAVHADFNRAFLVSSLCLLVPSLFFTVLLGSRRPAGVRAEQLPACLQSATCGAPRSR